jgi:hypothetical protein
MMEEPDVARELLGKLLFVESEAELEKLLEIHPELHPYAEVALPMHEAINMLLMVQQSNGADPTGWKILSIQEYKPGISAILVEDQDGKRIMELYEVPAEVLTEIVVDAPDETRAYIAPTLQVGLHHPEYLTVQSYWMLDLLVKSGRMEPLAAQKVSRLQAALGACLERGYDGEWIAGIR